MNSLNNNKKNKKIIKWFMYLTNNKIVLSFNYLIIIVFYNAGTVSVRP